MKIEVTPEQLDTIKTALEWYADDRTECAVLDGRPGEPDPEQMQAASDAVALAAVLEGL